MPDFGAVARLVPEVVEEAASRTRDRDAERGRLRQACRDMEAHFLNTLLEKMNGAESSRGLFGDNPQARMYRGMFHEAVAREMADRGALGIGEMIYRQLAPSIDPADSSPAQEEAP